MLRNRPQVIPHSVHFGGAVAGADLRLVSVDCNSPHPKGNLLTRIADILSRHGPDAWLRVAPFDLWLNLQFELYYVNHKCGILWCENTTLLIFK
jgi:hypothetical protein